MQKIMNMARLHPTRRMLSHRKGSHHGAHLLVASKAEQKTVSSRKYMYFIARSSVIYVPVLFPCVTFRLLSLASLAFRCKRCIFPRSFPFSVCNQKMVAAYWSEQNRPTPSDPLPEDLNSSKSRKQKSWNGSFSTVSGAFLTAFETD